jgi:hypothetical protein
MQLFLHRFEKQPSEIVSSDQQPNMGGEDVAQKPVRSWKPAGPPNVAPSFNTLPAI